MEDCLINSYRKNDRGSNDQEGKVDGSGGDGNCFDDLLAVPLSGDASSSLKSLLLEEENGTTRRPPNDTKACTGRLFFARPVNSNNAIVTRHTFAARSIGIVVFAAW